MKIAGFDQLKRMAANVRAAPDAAERAAYRAVNTVATKVSTQVRRDIAIDIDLPQGYIQGLMTITKAGPQRPISVIRMRKRAVRLARYDARQITKVAKAAKRAKGDALRGIAAGRKAAGVSVRVSRKGKRETMPGAFLMPLRAGKVDGGNGMGVFGRWKGKLEHFYGPSPDQLFRRWKVEAAPDVKRMLAEAYASQLRYELRGSRK